MYSFRSISSRIHESDSESWLKHSSQGDETIAASSYIPTVYRDASLVRCLAILNCTSEAIAGVNEDLGLDVSSQSPDRTTDDGH